MVKHIPLSRCHGLFVFERKALHESIDERDQDRRTGRWRRENCEPFIELNPRLVLVDSHLVVVQVLECDISAVGVDLSNNGRSEQAIVEDIGAELTHRTKGPRQFGQSKGVVLLQELICRAVYEHAREFFILANERLVCAYTCSQEFWYEKTVLA